jgi:hypothetical protein
MLVLAADLQFVKARAAQGNEIYVRPASIDMVEAQRLHAGQRIFCGCRL